MDQLHHVTIKECERFNLLPHSHENIWEDAAGQWVLLVCVKGCGGIGGGLFVVVVVVCTRIPVRGRAFVLHGLLIVMMVMMMMVTLGLVGFVRRFFGADGRGGRRYRRIRLRPQDPLGRTGSSMQGTIKFRSEGTLFVRFFLFFLTVLFIVIVFVVLTARPTPGTTATTRTAKSFTAATLWLLLSSSSWWFGTARRRSVHGRVIALVAVGKIILRLLVVVGR